MKRVLTLALPMMMLLAGCSSAPCAAPSAVRTSGGPQAQARLVRGFTQRIAETSDEGLPKFSDAAVRTQWGSPDAAQRDQLVSKAQTFCRSLDRGSSVSGALESIGVADRAARTQKEYTAMLVGLAVAESSVAKGSVCPQHAEAWEKW